MGRSCAGAWGCFPVVAGQNNGATCPVRFDAAGVVECMSTDGANCLWGTVLNCASLVASPALGLKPRKCTADLMRDPTSYCYAAVQALLPAPQDCE